MSLSKKSLYFEKTLVFFWTIWWSIALWTDLIGAFSHLKWLDASWAPDTNYPFLKASLAMYHAPEWLIATFFIGIIAWSSLATLSFAYASLRIIQNKTNWFQDVERAFAISISFWLAFFLADQMVMKFDLEENHMVQGGFQLLSYVFLLIKIR